MKSKGKKFRRKFPVNHHELTWRHPKDKPLVADVYLGIFWAKADDGEEFFQLVEAFWQGKKWMVDDDTFEYEDLPFSLIAWMPFPEIPTTEKSFAN